MSDCPSCSVPLTSHLCNDTVWEVEHEDDVWVFTCEELMLQVVALTFAQAVDEIERITSLIMAEEQEPAAQALVN